MYNFMFSYVFEKRVLSVLLNVLSLLHQESLYDLRVYLLVSNIQHLGFYLLLSFLSLLHKLNHFILSYLSTYKTKIIQRFIFLQFASLLSISLYQCHTFEEITKIEGLITSETMPLRWFINTITSPIVKNAAEKYPSILFAFHSTIMARYSVIHSTT